MPRVGLEVVAQLVEPLLRAHARVLDVRVEDAGAVLLEHHRVAGRRGESVHGSAPTAQKPANVGTPRGDEVAVGGLEREPALALCLLGSANRTGDGRAHRSVASRAWSSSQAAVINPTWLNACGKLPSSSPF